MSERTKFSWVRQAVLRSAQRHRNRERAGEAHRGSAAAGSCRRCARRSAFSRRRASRLGRLGDTLLTAAVTAEGMATLVLEGVTPPGWEAFDPRRPLGSAACITM
jgi:hypothetical protein